MAEDNTVNKKIITKLELKNQGKFILGFCVIFFAYFGILCNVLMYEEVCITYGTEFHCTFVQIRKDDWSEGFLLIWSFLAYGRTFFLPVLVLFFTCFLLTFSESNPHYGIKSSIWYVPITIVISFLWYWFIFGFSGDPFVLQFASWQGYVNIVVLYAINLSGALLGMKLNKFIKSRREKMEEI